MTVSINPKGQDFVRVAIARAVGGNNAALYASERWGIQRTAVSGGTTSDPNYGPLAVAPYAAFEYLELVAEATVLGRLVGTRNAIKVEQAINWFARVGSVGAAPVDVGSPAP